MANFDVIICGGGHVGSCLALALAKQNINVAFVDSIAPAERNHSNNDNRIFALAAGSKIILENLGVWDFLKAHVTPIEHIHVSNKGSFGAARLHAKDFQQDALGYMTASTALQQALNHAMEAIITTGNITHFSPASIENFSVYDDHVDVILSNNKKLTGKWLIGADGVNSFVRQHAHIGITKKDYQQKALVTLIDLENSHHFTAYERFVGETAIALLPHTPWQSVLIWSGDNDFIDELMQRDDTFFLNKLQQAFGYRLGKFSTLSPRFSYALSQTQADKIISERLLLIGNAAQTLHPIGAQGFNLALRHVNLLAQLLKNTNSSNKFSHTILEEYARHQDIDTRKTLRFTDHLVRFSASSGPLHNTARTLLINALGASSLVQRYLLDD